MRLPVSIALSVVLAASPAAAEPVRDQGAGHGKAISAGALGGLYAGLTVWAYFAWYRDKPQKPFTVDGDGWFGQDTYAGGADKLGHFWSNHLISRTTTEILIHGGWEPLPASLIASGLCLTFFTMVEVKDGYYYQFSTGDMVGNTAGAALSALMINVPEVDRWLDLRLEYLPTDEYIDSLSSETDVNLAEDYSGQTYYLALHLEAVPGLDESPWTDWTRYVDLVGGFRSRNYKPEPHDPAAVRRQEVFFGAAVNLQQVIDRLFASSSRGARAARRTGHTVFEYVSPPYTTLRLAGLERSTGAN